MTKVSATVDPIVVTSGTAGVTIATIIDQVGETSVATPIAAPDHGMTCAEAAAYLTNTVADNMSSMTGAAIG
jgi:hypothetical protein